MRRSRRVWRSDPPLRVTVAELLQHGLDRHPEAVAIQWTDSDVVVCRRHALDPVVLRIIKQIRPMADGAKVLLGRGRHRPNCVHCVTQQDYRRQVERVRQRR